MSRSSIIQVANPEGKEIWVPCERCGKETVHLALTKVKLHDESEDGDIQVWHQYYTIKCLGCKTVSFCEEHQCTEDCDPWSGELINFQSVYPCRIACRPLLDDIYDLPQGVATIYKETHKALSDKLAILAGIGLRAIVEAVCNERNTQGNNLNEKIDDLNKQGILTKDACDILHAIRLLGNDAAHKTQGNTEKELFTAFEVVEHLLKTVYIIPQKAKKLKDRP
ncbi:MAG: DUF4145 domain-containing protein [bacterium]